MQANNGLVQWRITDLADKLRVGLSDLRITMSASQALIVYRPLGEYLRVLASDSATDPVFIPDEPIHFDVPWTPGPRTLDRGLVTSAMRPVSMELQQAVIVPFIHREGRGAVVLGSAKSVTDAANDVVADLAEQVARLRAHEGRVRHADIDRAYRMVARAASAELSLDRVFDMTLVAAKHLLDSDVAYLSTPVDDENFFFARTLGVTTDEFRNLRVGYGEGLGGAARALERPVRSLNYDDDHNLRAAKLKETKGEGIFSALATPICEHGNVEAVMYVASREPRAYSEVDEQVLTDFSGAALLGMQRALLEEQRGDTIREQERLRIARKLHDDLVRRLTQIGLAAQQLQQPAGVNGPADHHAAGHAMVISATVDECMALIRDELHDLVSREDGDAWTVDMVGQRIMELPTITGMQRAVRYVGLPRASGIFTVIDADIAATMCAIGQEALFNAEHHSAGQRCVVEVGLHGGDWRLTVADDGSAPSDLGAGQGHMGLELMRREARTSGGRVSFQVNDQGGLTVAAIFPYKRAEMP